jgi:murein DD-endopeptidase MepM/ murein hydrolase activator NlpD
MASARKWWVGAVCVVLLGGCASIPFDHTAQPASTQQASVTQADDDDWEQLNAQLRSDLSRFNSREVVRKPSVTPNATTAKTRDKEFADRAKALFTPLGTMALRMPVVGVVARELSDSWHDPREGHRLHKGIDIFAHRGTEVVAVADGIVSYIGEQRLGGRCIWLTTESGTAFYYAHLDRWAPGLYEGMEVQAGDLLGYVGNTGNAAHTPSHLHFGINQNDDMVDPYPLLTRAVPTQHARLHVDLGGGFGTR